MTNYNFNIKNLSFTVSQGNKSLNITVSGSGFPEPDDTSGSIDNGDVVFDLSGSGESVNKAAFSYSGNGYTSGNFRFINVPDSTTLSGETKNYDLGGLFELDDCSLTAESNNENKKSLGVKNRKKPGVSQNYSITSFKLDQVTLDGVLQLVALIKVEESVNNDLKATCEDLIDFNDFSGPLPIVIQNEDADTLEVIARIDVIN
ncbi:MAG TPA: hypothetical protein DDW81_13300 [Cryomorphaceae bacterium]|nr:hypothetical protein [Owenweeksia sp.]HBF21070.1 hypothetical protein [Cryomorphaceae bacterium]HCQ15460.1 hypothetical protein [Cryomorphaceae bacterium]|tara:strand:- start:7 stop:615 length:609 start_codon:yes stop_codon:yes gene_type:complete